MKTEVENLVNPLVIHQDMLKETSYRLENGYEGQVQIADELDVESIIEIQKACYGGEAPWDRLTVFNELNRVNSFFLLVNHHGEGLAFVAAAIKKGRLHITNIGTKPAFQRQGLAEFLIQSMIKIAQELKLEVLTLEVRVSNQKAKNLYYKIGFKDRYIKKNYYRDNNEDALEMIYTMNKKDEDKGG